MNDFRGFAERRAGGWYAMLRFASDGQAEPVLGAGGDPILYGDELTATKAVLAHVLAYFNGHLVRSGEIAGGNIKEAKFQKAERQLFRKGRAIEVQSMKGGIIRE
ncbi:MAG: hypothetical protein JWL86_2094 [Rhizobium sp.]|nr:hypothetical protein [Rhizobium sp.]